MSETSDKIAILKELQALDRQLAHFRRMREYEPRRLADREAKLAAETAKLKELSDRHGTKQHDITRKELDVKTHEEKIKRFKGQLLTADSNRTYQGLMNEISLEEMEKRKDEDAILEIMIGMESYASEEAEIRDRVAASKAELEKVREDVRAALAEAAEKEKVVSAARREVAAKLDMETLKVYEGLFRSRNGEAVVEATYEAGMGGEEARYMCRGCFMPLTHQTVNTILIGNNIVTCKSCGRILFIEARGEKR